MRNSEHDRATVGTLEKPLLGCGCKPVREIHNEPMPIVVLTPRQ